MNELAKNVTVSLSLPIYICPVYRSFVSGNISNFIKVILFGLCASSNFKCSTRCRKSAVLPKRRTTLKLRRRQKFKEQSLL